jgi:hypothetical protein
MSRGNVTHSLRSAGLNQNACPHQLKNCHLKTPSSNSSDEKSC